MIRYVNEEFQKEVEEALKYFKSITEHSGGAIFELDQIEDIGYDEDEEDVIIDKEYNIRIYFEYIDNNVIEISLKKLIEVYEIIKTVDLLDDTMYITNNRCCIRISGNLFKIFEEKDQSFKEFIIENKYYDTNIRCSIKRLDLIFGLLVCKCGNYDKYNPCFWGNEFFIQIDIEDKIFTRDQIQEICNSYIFEINSAYDLGIKIEKRDFYYEDEEEIENDNFKIRNLMFGKGMNNIIKLFNNADVSNANYDYKIMEFIKIFEYVSQTIIREELIEKANKKLYSNKALNPDANYIKELEEMFISHKNKYDTDRNAIKATIMKCCDILDLVEHMPKYLKKIKQLPENIKKPKANKEELINESLTLFAASISDTRNCLAHAKANYSDNGNECPECDKEQFVKVLRIASIQVIRWFNTESETNRII